mmetsp:Transcript_8466/g.25440  ORF Transcript_8466/g.25440 Transcript_8466/m.25440 type:complete len:222 (+) Transcript_8466:73-738(+)
MDKVNDTVRRKWDRAAFERRAEERQRAGEEAERERERAREAKRPDKEDRFAPTRPWLEARTAAVDLESKVGKSELVAGARDKRSGFYCEICQSLHKDSQAYLNHTNSRFHQKNLGMSMRVKRSTVDDVRSKFKQVADEHKKEKKVFDFQERVRQREEEEKRQKKERQERKKAQRQRKNGTDSDGEKAGDTEDGAADGADDDEHAQMMAAMGLPVGFNTSKK